MELGYVDGGIGAEEGGVDGGERGSLRSVGFGVGVGGGEKSEEGILHGGLLGGEGRRGEERCGKKGRLDGG